MAAHRGWSLVNTDNGASFTQSILKNFDVVIWNNVSGDALTLSQRKSFTRYIEHGGGFVGIHGAGGDPVYFWDWYADTLIGARFEGHPMDPQFQDARIVVVEGNEITRETVPGWTMKDEWYSFRSNPRIAGAHVLANLAESSYRPTGPAGEDLRMGDHPIIWNKCIGNGRSFYSAIGHLPETYSEPHYYQLLEQGIAWAAGAGGTICRAGAELLRPHR
jgi:type 1 glutamine amidotransferase